MFSLESNIATNSSSQIKFIHRLLSASPVKGRHGGFQISICSYLLHPPPSLQPLPRPLTASINLLLGLPHFLFPGSSILSIVLQIYPTYFLLTCPNHLSLASRVFSPNRPICAVPLMYSFLILYILVTPNENRNIFNCPVSLIRESLLLQGKHRFC